MARLSDDSRDLLAEQEHDAREIGHHDDPPTDDELDEMAEGYDCLEDVIDAVFAADDFPADDTRHPY